MYQVRFLPCQDPDELAAQMRSELALRPKMAESLGRSAVEAIELGYYLTNDGKVEWIEAVRSACESKVSIASETELPTGESFECGLLPDLLDMPLLSHTWQTTNLVRQHTRYAPSERQSSCHAEMTQGVQSANGNAISYRIQFELSY